MVEKVVIRDNKKTPLEYISKLRAFKNGKEYVFKPGVNIIVGENGCGKTTLLKLIRNYLLVDSRECDAGEFNCNTLALHDNFVDKNLLDGVEVYADYYRNTFRLLHKDEKTKDDICSSSADFYEHFEQLHSSTGEGVTIALDNLFHHMFDKNAHLTFDYLQFKDVFPEYLKYIAEHIIEGNEWTILMDEPDRNLSINKIKQLKGILDFHKPQTQLICVIHNPLLIMALKNNPDVNIIEMTRGYVNRVTKIVNELTK